MWSTGPRIEHMSSYLEVRGPSSSNLTLAWTFFNYLSERAYLGTIASLTLQWITFWNENICKRHITGTGLMWEQLWSNQISCRNRAAGRVVKGGPRDDRLMSIPRLVGLSYWSQQRSKLYDLDELMRTTWNQHGPRLIGYNFLYWNTCGLLDHQPTTFLYYLNLIYLENNEPYYVNILTANACYFVLRALTWTNVCCVMLAMIPEFVHTTQGWTLFRFS